MEDSSGRLPVIDVRPLLGAGPRDDPRDDVAGEIADACRTYGFFYITGHGVLRGVALSLGLDEEYFANGYTADPTVFSGSFTTRPPPDTDEWGVGEHTDYGLLTLLAQDEAGGLQVHTPQPISPWRADRRTIVPWTAISLWMLGTAFGAPIRMILVYAYRYDTHHGGGKRRVAGRGPAGSGH